MASSTSFPVISSPPFGPTSYSLPFFQPDAVLTHTQLNDWFSFVMAQEQATRTRLLGVGIATGLRATLSGSTVSISAGCGLTSEGHLLRLETAQTYTGYLPYTALSTDGPLTACTLLELRPAGQGGKPLAELVLENYAVLLFQNSFVPPVDNCLGLDCKDNGATYETKLRVLLVPTAQATSYLLSAGAMQAANAYARLPVLAMRRPVLTDPSYLTRLLSLKGVVQRAAATLGAALTQAAGLVQYIDGFGQVSDAATFAEALPTKAATFESLAEGKLTKLYQSADAQLSNLDERLTTGRVSSRMAYVEQWRQRLIARVSDLSSDANIQYIYDWLKDLYDAYEEFRQATASPDWLAQAMPAASSFPRHLVLGELVPAAGLNAPQCRHAWQPALTSSHPTPDAPARGLWLFQRIGSLITQFGLLPLPSSEGVSGAAAASQVVKKVQQSMLETMLINTMQSAAPESEAASNATQQVTALLKNDAFTSSDAYKSFTELTSAALVKNTSTDVSFELPSEAPAPTVPDVPTLRIVPDRARPASFDERSLPFYYGTGMRERWSYARTTTYQTALILSYTPATNAPAQVAQPLEYQLDGYDFYRVEGLLDAPAANVLARLLALRKQYSLPFDVVAVCAEPLGTVQTALTPPNPQFFADQLIEFKDLLQQLQDYAASQGYSATSDGFQLELSTSAFSAAMAAYLRATSSTDTVLRRRLTLLVELNRAYNARLTSLNSQLSFSSFLAANPGLEHGAGVPRGGTLVIVYRTPTTTPSTFSSAVPLVVGDYYLPYRQSGAGPVVQLEVLQPKPLVSLTNNAVNNNIAKLRLNVTPIGGRFTDPAVVREGDEYYLYPKGLFGVGKLDPNKVNKYELTYVVEDNPNTAKAVVVLLPDPKITAFSVDVDPKGKATFSYTVYNANKVVIEFGDTKLDSALIKMPGESDATSEYVAVVDSKEAFPHYYNGITTRIAKLTAYMDDRSSVPASVEVNFAAVPISLQVDKNQLGTTIVTNKVYELVGLPAGAGYYSSATLANADGSLPLNQSTYRALTAGVHSVSYNAGRAGSATKSLFAVPDKFTPMSTTEKEPYFEFKEGIIAGSVTLPTPPDNVLYDWSLGIEPLQQGPDFFTQDSPDGTTTYQMRISAEGFRKPGDVPLLTLRVYATGKPDSGALRSELVAESPTVGLDLQSLPLVTVSRSIFPPTADPYQTPGTASPTKDTAF
jgi:hypothetical protein